MSGLTDRELLEGAARAAGIGPVIGYAAESGNLIIGPRSNVRYWNPRADDGQALRLAVACRLYITVDYDVVSAWLQDGSRHCDLPVGQDIQADVRSAIVRAAYEIGSAMS